MYNSNLYIFECSLPCNNHCIQLFRAYVYNTCTINGWTMQAFCLDVHHRPNHKGDLSRTQKFSTANSACSLLKHT